MKHDLTDATFIIPLKLESADRHANFQVITQFLNENFNTNIFVYELGVNSFNESGQKEEVPLVPELVKDIDNVTHFFRSGFENEKVIPFYRTKYLNHMLNRVQTPITITYDADILMDPLNLIKACEEIRNQKFDLVYPFSIGEHQLNIEGKAREHLLCQAATLGWSEDVLVSCSITGWDSWMPASAAWRYANQEPDSIPPRPLLYLSTYGQAQVFSTQSYKEGGGENQAFKGWGPEDKERYYRFTGLGYRVKHLSDAKVFHLNHSRGPDSCVYQNPTYVKGWTEAFKVVNLPTEKMKQYAEELKEYNANN